MRFRTDGYHYAELKGLWDVKMQNDYRAKFLTEEEAKYWDSTPAAVPGDVWRIHWRVDDGAGGSVDGPVAGYAICCPACKHVHQWTMAGNCNQSVTLTYKDSTGADIPYRSCVHSGTGSCWSWSGSAEENNLTGSPSLQVINGGSGDCKWHGFIQAGDIHN